MTVAKKTMPVKFNFVNTMFELDTKRDLKVAKVESYQMSLVNLVNNMLDTLPESEFKLLPSWSKFATCPELAENFLVSMLQALFMSKHNRPELSVARQTYASRKAVDALPTRMFFFGKIRNENLAVVGDIFKKALGAGYHIVTLYGGNEINGKRVDNRKAQQIVLDEITRANKRNQQVIIIASNLAQRSFSIPQITELYLAYDAGQFGATVQKISRALTPSDENKVGRIFSLSFDPNRDDKFDALILQTALAEKKKNPSKTMEEIMMETLDTIDLFSCQAEGAVKVNSDDYLIDALNRSAVSRAIGKLADVDKLTVGMMKALLASDVEAFRSELQEVAEKGKTKEAAGKKKNGAATDAEEREAAKELARVREVITAIVEHLDMVLYASDAGTVSAGLAAVKSDSELRADFAADFGVDVDVVAGLFELGVINEAHAEMVAMANAAQ